MGIRCGLHRIDMPNVSRSAGLMKLIWHDGIGLCMLTKRLEQGQFAWPSATSTGRIALSAAQLAALLIAELVRQAGNFGQQTGPSTTDMRVVRQRKREMVADLVAIHRTK